MTHQPHKRFAIMYMSHIHSTGRRFSAIFYLTLASTLGCCGKAEEKTIPSQETLQATSSAPSTASEADGTYRVCALEVKAAELMKLMEAGDYAPVSSFILKLRDSRATTPGGMSAANVLVGTMTDQKDIGASALRWLEKDPTSDVAHLLYGIWCIQEAWRWRGGDVARNVTEIGWEKFNFYIEKARENLTRAISLDPKDYLAAEEMITVAMAQSNKTELRLWFQRATSIHPEFFEAYDNFAYALLPRWLGAPGESRAFVEANQGRSPLFAMLAYEYLSVENCETLKDPDSRAFAMVKPILAQYIKNFPNSGAAYYKYGNLLYNAGKAQEALPYLKKAVELDPTSQSRFRLARTLMDANQYAEAAEQLESASQLAPDDDQIWLNLGLCLKKTGDNEKAAQCFTKAIAIDPDTRTAWIRRGEIRMYAGRYEEAIPDFNEAIRRWPNHYQAYYYLGGCLYWLGKKAEARQAFEKAVELNPKIRPAVEEFMQRQGEAF